MAQRRHGIIVVAARRMSAAGNGGNQWRVVMAAGNGVCAQTAYGAARGSNVGAGEASMKIKSKLTWHHQSAKQRRMLLFWHESQRMAAGINSVAWQA